MLCRSSLDGFLSPEMQSIIVPSTWAVLLARIGAKGCHAGCRPSRLLLSVLRWSLLIYLRSYWSTHMSI